MNARIPLAIVASTVSFLLLVLAGWGAGFVGVVFGLVIIAAGWLKFISYLGILCLPSAVKGLSSGAMVVGIFSIIVIGVYRSLPLSIKASPPKISAAAAPALPEYPLCADGEYDFSNWDIKKAGKVDIQFQQNCFSKVTLPQNVCWRTHPSVDVEVVWSDGSKYIDGPNRLTPGINGKRLFVIKGLRESGVLQISFEKQV